MDLVVTGSADKNLVDKWDIKLKACQQARVNFERQWHENLSFYFGRQWVVTSPYSNGFQIVEQAKKDRWRVRHTANKILPRIRIELTKLSKEEPQFFCLPASTEEKDRLAAMAGDAIAEFIIRTRYFNRIRLETTFWTLICGTAFIKNFYDPHKPDLDGINGKIDFDVVTPLHLLVPNLHATEIEAQPYVGHVRTMNPEDVELCYGISVPPDSEASSTIIDSRFFSVLGIKNQTSTTKQCFVKEVYVKKCKDFPNGAMFVYANSKLLYVYEAPVPEGPLMPEIPAAMDNIEPGTDLTEQMQMLEKLMPPTTMPVGFESGVQAPKSEYEGLDNYQHEYPYRHGRYPFAKIDHVPTGMFYAKSIVETLIPMQKEYNRTRSIMLEHRNMGGKPQWSYVKGAFDPRKFTSEPGLLLAIQMGFDPPRPMDQPQMAPNISAELDIAIRDMDEASNQFEVTRGRTPPGVEAASAIAYLSEENDTSLYHTVQSLENAVQETGIQVLANVHDFWPEERIVRMTSRNQFMEVREFKKSDLNPIMDFRVETGSMAPRSLAAKQAFITELMKMGVIGPDQGLRYLQMSETNKLYEDLMLDVRHAQRENVYMSQGNPLYKVDTAAPQQMDPMLGYPVGPTYLRDVERDPSSGEPMTGQDGQPMMYNVTINPYDDHEIHIREHQNFQKSQEYELLDPQIWKIIQDHVDEHKMEMLKERNAIQADASKKGEVPGEETPPPGEIQDAGPPASLTGSASPNGSGY